MLLTDHVQPPMLFFIVFYGLDWVATVPPTVALCRQHFGEDGAIVFGWVLASHQIGAGLVALGAGIARDSSAPTTPRGTPPVRSASWPPSCPYLIQRRPERNAQVRQPRTGSARGGDQLTRARAQQTPSPPD